MATLSQFQHAVRGGAFGNQIAYPDDVITDGVLEFDGATLWGRTTVIDDGAGSKIVVGTYNGPLTLDPYTPPKRYRTDVTEYELIKLFTDAEFAAFLAAVKTDPHVETLDRMVRAASTSNRTIDLTDSKSVGGLNYMESVGIIGAGRAAEILLGVEL